MEDINDRDHFFDISNTVSRNDSSFCRKPQYGSPCSERPELFDQWFLKYIPCSKHLSWRPVVEHFLLLFFTYFSTRHSIICPLKAASTKSSSFLFIRNARPSRIRCAASSYQEQKSPDDRGLGVKSNCFLTCMIRSLPSLRTLAHSLHIIYGLVFLKKWWDHVPALSRGSTNHHPPPPSSSKRHVIRWAPQLTIRFMLGFFFFH